MVKTPERPTVYDGGTGLTSLAAGLYLPTIDSRRTVKEKPIIALDGYERVTPPQAVKIGPGYYKRLVLRVTAIAAALAAAGFALYLLIGFVI